MILNNSLASAPRPRHCSRLHGLRKVGGGRSILENVEHHKVFKVQHFKDMKMQTKEIVEEYMQNSLVKWWANKANHKRTEKTNTFMKIQFHN